MKTTCDGKFKIGVDGSNMDHDECKKYCNEEENCKYVFHIPSLENSDQLNCIKYSSCEGTRTTAYVGTTYSKEISLGINLMIISGDESFLSQL